MFLRCYCDNTSMLEVVVESVECPCCEKKAAGPINGRPDPSYSGYSYLPTKVCEVRDASPAGPNMDVLTKWSKGEDRLTNNEETCLSPSVLSDPADHAALPDEDMVSFSTEKSCLDATVKEGHFPERRLEG